MSESDSKSELEMVIEADVDEKDNTTVFQAEERAAGAEEKMRRAAEIGRDLLEKNIQLGTELEVLQQEKHEINLRLQTKLNVEKSLLGEVDNLRDAIRQLEEKREERDMDEQERWGKREEVWKAKVAEAEVSLNTVETREKILQERLKVTERQLAEAAEVMNQSVGGQTMSLELAELQSLNMELVQEKQRLESEVLGAKSETAESRAEGQAASARAELLQRELEEAHCSITSYSRAVEAGKTEVMELQAQLDAMQMDNVNQDGKGNSLFSEVNDRREKVETQLKIYQENFEVLKKNYDIKMSELQKTKMHNAKLLSIAGSGRNDSGQVSRLEELLTAERNKNKILRERLDSLEKLSVREEPTPAMAGPGLEEGDDTGVVPHTQSSEYSYLSDLLKQTKSANNDLKSQLQLQMRQSLEDSDKIRELTRKVNMFDSSSQKLKADNYSLKIQIDELKCKKGDQQVSKKEPVKIFEKLHFERKPEAENPKEEFVLKEKTINRPKLSKTPSPAKKDTEKVKENQPEEKPKKKAAFFAENVEKISVEGEKETSALSSSSPKEKVKLKPQGKKKFGAANTIYVDTEANQAEQCKQQ